jgi:hypothetical protein
MHDDVEILQIGFHVERRDDFNLAAFSFDGNTRGHTSDKSETCALPRIPSFDCAFHDFDFARRKPVEAIDDLVNQFVGEGDLRFQRHERVLGVVESTSDFASSESSRRSLLDTAEGVSPRIYIFQAVKAYSTSCFSGLVPSAPTHTMLRMTSGSPMPNDHRMPKYSAT